MGSFNVSCGNLDDVGGRLGSDPGDPSTGSAAPISIGVRTFPDLSPRLSFPLSLAAATIFDDGHNLSPIKRARLCCLGMLPVGAWVGGQVARIVRTIHQNAFWQPRSS